MRSIAIKSHQVGHFKRLREIFKTWFVAVDNTGTGGGKTVTTTAVAMSLGLSLVVIAPPITHTSWRETAEKYKVPLLHISSYEKLRQGSCLVRKLPIDELQKRGSDAPSEFEHTDFFVKLLVHGILLVFDEFHNLKTDKTLQLKAAHCLVRAVVSFNKTVSRLILLSATPCDKFEHAVSILKMLGIMTHLAIVGEGVVEVGEIAREINPLALSTITAEFGGQVQTFTRMKPKRAAQFAFDVYRDIFRPFLSSCAQHQYSPAKNQQLHQKFNGFFKFPEKDVARIKKAYEAFENSAGSSSIHITQILIELEEAKINTFARLIKERLDVPHIKIIVYLNYRNSLEMLNTLLSAYAPLSLSGSTSDAERTAAVSIFQKPSDEARLLIVHPQVGGVGVNLDDQHGNFPREQLVSPSFSFISTCQLMGRVDRTSTKSPTKSYLVFCSEVPEEIKILDNLSGKAGTMRGFRPDLKTLLISDDISSTETVYPGEYPSFFE